jgi:hypothetical protein
MPALVFLAGCRDCGRDSRSHEGTAAAIAPLADEVPPAGTARVEEERWPNGQLKLRRQVVETRDGQLLQHGTLEVWYESGKPRSVGNWANGQKHGHFRFWHENGQPKAEVDYRHGRAEGVAIFWDEAGHELRRENWRGGKLVETPIHQ